jgi:putative serine protease PepD
MSNFNDIGNHWAVKEIEWAVKRGLIKGSLNPDGTYSFNPDKALTRAEYCVLESRKEYVKSVLRKSGPAVVKITNRATGSSGSGTILRKDGLILTNYHVIQGEKQGGWYEVNLNESPWYSMGPCVAYDKGKDLALILLLDSNKNFPVVKLSSEAPQQGEDIIAVGSPLGMANTVTKGIVSNTDRSFAYLDPNVSIKMIQIDAAINGGNSGGALLDMDGELLGVPSMKLGDSLVKDSNGNITGVYPIESMGFAIHVDEVRRFLNSNNIVL